MRPAFAGTGGIIADDGEFGFPLLDRFVHQAFRLTNSHESADHDGRAIGKHCNGFFRRNDFHGRVRFDVHH